MIALNSVTKKFGTFTAVDNITYRIEKGEYFALLGPNGAGKTILDEPVTDLDPIGIRDVKKILESLRDNGVTVFLNSHLIAVSVCFLSLYLPDFISAVFTGGFYSLAIFPTVVIRS